MARNSCSMDDLFCIRDHLSNCERNFSHKNIRDDQDPLASDTFEDTDDHNSGECRSPPNISNVVGCPVDDMVLSPDNFIQICTLKQLATTTISYLVLTVWLYFV